MKTYFTIEIKDGRVQPHTQSVTPRIVAAPGSQRAGMAEVVVRVMLACCGPSSVLTSTSMQPGGAAGGAAHAKSAALCPRRVTAPH
ncbi:hypothetical protein CIB84_008637 [Bambusicola thoracicus]|uniref:Uncharacterized protein n=1 Tax=Bambusicola thoracicus TaxID=9083 RepID=A0A2P4SU27_BAMTH|nr:hypothetical protein CIB84_008637 [Bambusicola thoracicus]